MSWLSSIFHPPQAPDPAKTAAAQADLNKQSAITQYGLNATNQVTPDGSLTYSQNGTWPDGTPKFTATTALSSGQQSLYNQDLATKNKMAGMAGAQADQLGGVLGTPWNPDTAVADKLAGMQHQFLDPQWEANTNAFDAKEANQGITKGSDAYNTDFRNFNDSKNRAYNDMYINADQQGFNQSLAQRNQPFNEFAAFQNGTQIQNPNFTNTPQSQISTPDLAGMTYQNYQGQLGYQNAAMGGVFGLGGAALGAAGKALGGWAGSDIRFKRDIVKIGDVNDDIGLYRFRYKWSNQVYVGVMAQEVEKTRPDAIIRDGDGYLYVKYAAIGAPFMTWEEWTAPLEKAA